MREKSAKSSENERACSITIGKWRSTPSNCGEPTTTQQLPLRNAPDIVLISIWRPLRRRVLVAWWILIKSIKYIKLINNSHNYQVPVPYFIGLAHTKARKRGSCTGSCTSTRGEVVRCGRSEQASEKLRHWSLNNQRCITDLEKSLLSSLIAINLKYFLPCDMSLKGSSSQPHPSKVEVRVMKSKCIRRNA